MEFNSLDFGERLKEIRIQHGLSMLALGKDIGTSASRIKSWESGESVPSANWIVAIAERFNISTDLLLINSPLKQLEWSEEMYEISESATTFNFVNDPEEQVHSQLNAFASSSRTDVEWEDIMNGTSSQDDLSIEDLFPGKSQKQRYLDQLTSLYSKLTTQDLMELYTLAEVKTRNKR